MRARIDYKHGHEYNIAVLFNKAEKLISLCIHEKALRHMVTVKRRNGQQIEYRKAKVYGIAILHHCIEYFVCSTADI